MTKKTADTEIAYFDAEEAAELTKVTDETTDALIRHGYVEHAETIRRATEQKFVDGCWQVVAGTLLRWHRLFDHAFDLLARSPIDDPCIADNTAEIAGGLVYYKLGTIGITPTPLMTLQEMNSTLNEAYETIAALPKLRDPALDARLQLVVKLLDDLTLDTYDDTLDEAGICPRSPIEANIIEVAA